MATLIFVMNAETGRKLSKDAGCAFVEGPAGIPALIANLDAGKNVVALMRATATGFRIPEGAKIAFHPECPKDGPLRHQCEARAFRARPAPKSEKKEVGTLVYVARPSRALALAERMGAVSIVHPADIGNVQGHMASGTSVVMPIELSGEDFRIPLGSGIFFDPVLDKDPRRQRAGIHGMLCGAAPVSSKEQVRIQELIEELDAERVVFGVFAPVHDRSEAPDPV